MSTEINSSENESEIQAGRDGVRIRGGPAEDLRPLIQAAVGAATPVLRVAENMLGLPADFLSHHAEHIRERYQRKMDQVPVADRCPGNTLSTMRILREWIVTQDDEELQEMFAELLTASQRASMKQLVHPSFAMTISAMSPLEAKLINFLSTQGGREDRQALERAMGFAHDDTQTLAASLDNLFRLELIRWIPRQPDFSALRKPPGWRIGRMMTGSDTDRKVKELQQEFEENSSRIVEALQGTARQPTNLSLTALGRQFCSVCCPKESPME